MKILTAICLALATSALAEIPIDQSSFDAASGVVLATEDDALRVTWPVEREGSRAELILNLASDSPLIRSLGIAGPGESTAPTALRDAEPEFIVTVGSRNLDPRHGWIKFFDKVHTRPHETFRAELDPRSARVASNGRSATVILDGLTAGSFSGDLRFTVYPGTRLVHMEAVLSTEEDARAIVYDAGLSSKDVSWDRVAWLDSNERWRTHDQPSQAAAKEIATRYRTVIAESAGGSIAVFPPPHQYFYPLDFADNFGFNWRGVSYRNLIEETGLGIRQPLEGDQRFVPWFNAPPGTQQKLSCFLLVSGGYARTALEQVKRYTRGDHFKSLEGYRTFTSHYHIEHTLDYLRRQEESGGTGIPDGLEYPGFKKAFERAGVEIAHLAEFHNGRTPGLEAEERLKQLELMHRECQRLSDEDFLLLPGEEPNVHLGGHWISFFPKPIQWVLNRDEGAPFMENREGYGTVYHMGSAEDVLRLFEKEQGLMWTAHPRIKSSTGYPDAYNDRDFYKSDRFLGAAWKAMPADLSHERLGGRVLDLLDDMSNWGQPKYIPGEVDVFKVMPDYELYGHMNINYLKLDELPQWEEGWGSVLDALRDGEFFVTTGEILIPNFTVAGESSGERLTTDQAANAELVVEFEWTFPPNFAEVISGDGDQVFRERIDLRDRYAFGAETLRLKLDLNNRKWVRLEIWDIAANGAFTQPVWIGEGER